MVDEWLPFSWNVMLSLKPSSGVFELADENGKTIFIGGAENLHSCFEDLLTGSDPLGFKERVTMYRIEYREDYRSQVQFLKKLFKDTYENEPLYNQGYS